MADNFDLNDHLTPRKEISVLLKAKGDSMIEVVIPDGDILVASPSITASTCLVVIATVDGQFNAKTLEKVRGTIRLLPSNPNIEPIELNNEQELQI